MSDLLIGVILLIDNVFDSSKDLFEFWLEELWLNFSNFIELDQSVLKNDLFVFLICCDNNLGHIWNEILEWFGISSLDRL